MIGGVELMANFCEPFVTLDNDGFVEPVCVALELPDVDAPGVWAINREYSLGDDIGVQMSMGLAGKQQVEYARREQLSPQ